MAIVTLIIFSLFVPNLKFVLCWPVDLQYCGSWLAHVDVGRSLPRQSGVLLSDHLQVLVLVLGEHVGDGDQLLDGRLRLGQDLQLCQVRHADVVEGSQFFTWKES